MQVQACALLNNVCYGADAAGLAREQRAVEAGALEAVVAAMRAHPQVAAVQEEGSRALGSMCDGNDGLSALGLARSQRAVELGALEVLVYALQTHSQAALLSGCMCLGLTLTTLTLTWPYISLCMSLQCEGWVWVFSWGRCGRSQGAVYVGCMKVV